MLKAGIFRARAHRKLIHIRLADYHRISAQKPVNHRSVVRGVKVLQDLRGTRRGPEIRTHVVFDRNGHPSQLPYRFVGGYAFVNIGRGFQGQFFACADIGADGRLEPPYPLENRNRREGLHPDCPRGGLPLPGERLRLKAKYLST